MLNQNRHQKRLNSELKYVFRSNNQHIYKNEFDTYYIRGNIKHYKQKPVNRRYNQQPTTIRSPENNMKYSPQNYRRKSQTHAIGMASKLPEKCDTYCIQAICIISVIFRLPKTTESCPWQWCKQDSCR